MISSPGARILQMLDIHGVLGSQYMVVGTNALPVYEIEAGERFARGVDATEDFDLAWVGGTLHLSPAQAVVAQAPVAQLLALAEDALLLRLLNESPSDLMALLRRLDRTYTPNTERTFQARNAKGYEVELLSGTSLRSMPQSGSPSLVPLPLPEQDWLLLGKPVAHVITGLDACPARLVAPDPRYFALQKLWLARQAKRKVEKRAKDARQATLVLDAVARSMPDYPLNDAFADALPTPLQVLFSEWQTTRTTESSSADSLKTKRW